MIRFFDLFISIFALILLLPLILVLLLLGWFYMGSPMFAQTRVGRGGKNFTLYKFRSLPVSTADMPTHELNAATIPAYGKFIRRSKLDELPQLYCVLLGDMSLVGPRPGLPSQMELYKARKSRGVLNIRPGITGVSQIRKVDMSTPVKLARIDAIMIARLGLCVYFVILVQTLSGRGSGDRVRRS